MNGRKSKLYRKTGKQILVDWLRSVIPDEEDGAKITVKNIEDFVSEQTHVYMNRKFLLSAYSLKWIYKRVKRNPDLTFDQLKKDIQEYGLRNSLLIAPMPTASTSQILGNNECFEAFTSNIYTRRTLAGEFTIVNKYLIKDLLTKC